MVGLDKNAGEPLLAFILSPFAGGARPRCSSVSDFVSMSASFALFASLFVSLVAFVLLSLHASLALCSFACLCWCSACLPSSSVLPGSVFAQLFDHSPRLSSLDSSLLSGWLDTILMPHYWTLLLRTTLVPSYLTLLLCTTLISIYC